MNRRALIERAAKKTADARQEAYGAKFNFRGAEVDGVITILRQPIELERGGYAQKWLGIIRFSAEIQPVPAAQEEILELATGRTWFVVAPPGTNSSNPLAQEHVFNVQSA